MYFNCSILLVLLAIANVPQHSISFTSKRFVSRYKVLTSLSSSMPSAESRDLLSRDVFSRVKPLLSTLLNAGYGISNLAEVAEGLDQWSTSLLSGICPEFDTWPGDPIISDSIRQTFNKLQLPVVVKKHPVLLPSVLKAIVEMVVEYEHKVDRKSQESAESGHGNDNNPSSSSSTAPSSGDSLQSFKEELGKEIAQRFESRWAPPLGGLQLLDEIFGVDHDLISGADSSQDGVGGGMGTGAGGFGLFDGIWRNDGWGVVKELQARLKTMRELRELVRSLGRRPSATGECMKRTPPQVLNPSAPLGVARDQQCKDALGGIRKSDSLESLLPLETMLLSTAARSKRPKLLFLSKFAEKSLRSYEMTGWVNENSRSRRKPWRHFDRLPVTTGGPVIVCLDTSYSMVGPREQLAKAVVLEVATLSARENRPFFLLAFSGAMNLAECELKLGADKKSLVSLLNFLGNSFRGGTDVTAPLTRAVNLLEDTAEWASADVLLVTDGELMNPPLPQDLMDKILHLEKERGLEVHGLLIGQRFPTPQLEWICTKWDGINRVHNFLFQYDPLLAQFCAPQNEENERPESVLQRKDAGVSPAHRGSFVRSKRKRQTPRPRSLSLSMTAMINEAGGDSMSNFIEKVVHILSDSLIERDVEVKLLLLAALSREHIILLGPPGVGKSELARRLGQISGGIFFERLLTKFTAPEEVFGPLSLQALENDLYIRNINGYLPTASVAFLDEIFKSSSSILNSFLTILNERLYDNGNARVKVPLLTVVGASNELPDSEELDALYDRFLFRRMIAPISDGEIHRLLSQPATIQSQPITTALVSESLADEILREAGRVILPANVVNILVTVRAFLRDQISPSIYVSDRRLKKAAQALKVSAFCNGRSVVTVSDCLLLQHMLWYSPEDQEVINNWVWDSLIPSSELPSLRFLGNSIVRRLETALVQDSASSYEGELSELQKLSSVVKDKLRSAKELIAELSSPNVFLDKNTILRATQTFAPLALEEAQAYEDCNKALEFLQQELSMTNFSAEHSRQNSADSIAALKYSAIWQAGGFATKDGIFEESMELIFDKLDLTMSVKEAKKSLSKDEFKEWKRLKARRGDSSDADSVDSYWS